MGKGLVVVAAVVGVALAGCSGGGTDQSPQPQPQSGPPPAPAVPARTAPAKSLDVADKCSLVPAQEARQLGADQPPIPADANGQPGCRYRAGMAGSGGWAVNVAPDATKTMAQFQQNYRSQAKPTTIDGYPAVVVQPVPQNCYIALDVSDHGLLLTGGQARPGGQPADPCQKATEFAQAALKNLPNA